MKQLLVTCACVLFFALATHAQDAEREALIRQLQLLKKAVLAQDKQTVARFFQFPVKDEKLKNKIEWNANPSIKIKALDRKQFLQYYSRIITPDVVAFFKELEPEQLKEQQEWIKEVTPKSKKEFCYRTYEAVLMNNRLELSFFSNTRQDIQLSDEDYCEEYAEFWQFEWRNGQLLFRSIDMAG